MGMRAIDMTGEKIGMLRVIERAPMNSTSSAARWRCLCDCGQEHIATGGSLRRKNTQSCGCLRRKVVSKIAHRSKRSVTVIRRLAYALNMRVAKAKYAGLDISLQVVGTDYNKLIVTVPDKADVPTVKKQYSR